MSARMTPTKRFVVRTALVTSTTLATIMGAQALVSIDNTSLADQPTVPVQPNVDQPTGFPQTPSGTVNSAAPNIVILRRAGEQPTTTQSVTPQTVRPIGGATTPQIAPPNPVQIAPPRPAPVTRSSR